MNAKENVIFTKSQNEGEGEDTMKEKIKCPITLLIISILMLIQSCLFISML